MDRDWPGSSWWRVDLHAHSSASHDFRTTPDAPHTPVDWLSAAEAAGLDAVVVADHNTGVGIDPLKAARADLGHGPTIFPGVELTASDGSHLLFVLDPSCDGRHVDELLALARIPVGQRGRDIARSPLNVEALLDLRPEHQALVIGAHANDTGGLLTHDGQQRLRELRHVHLAAVEIKPTVPVDRSWIDGSLPETRVVPWVYGSDAHGTDDLGRRFTWVKMSSPTLDGLRLAFLDGQDSLWPVERGEPSNPNRHAPSAIESITVAHAKYMGLPAPYFLPLNPWFNAVIGGRGTGKSTLVDLARLVLHRGSDLGSSDEGPLRQAYDERMRVSAGRRDAGLLRAETTVTLVYRKDGQRYRLGWDRDGAVHHVVHLADGIETPEGGEMRERFPVRIYSQKQLFEMAQNPSSLLDVMDESPEVRGTEMRRQLSDAETRFLSLRAEARALHSQAASLAVKEANLVDLQRRIQVLSSGAQAEAFSGYARRNRQDREWSAAVKAVKDGVEGLRVTASNLAVPDVDLGADLEADSPARGLDHARSLLQGLLGSLSAEVAAAADRTAAQIDAVVSGPQAAEWSTEITAVTQAYQESVDQLSAIGIADPGQYRDLLQQGAALEADLVALAGRRDAAEAREADAIAELARYRATFAERERSRAAFCEARQSDHLLMSVQVVARERLIESLAEAIHGALATEAFHGDIRRIAERVAGPDSDAWDFARLDREVDKLQRGALMPGQSPWADQRFGAALGRVAPERLDRLLLLLPEQTVDVQRRDRGAWLPIAQGSPGQQTAALLSFVLSYGDEPIILDQPEDDLDSTLIYDLVVKQLRASKERRQVIVVTHNANIVVHGDAECITVLESQGGQTRTVFQGGLQESHARSEVCRVLEGGQTAFERRYQRITEGRRQTS